MASALGAVKRQGLVFVKEGYVHIVVNDPQGARAQVIKVNDVYLGRNDPPEMKFRVIRWDDGIQVQPLPKDCLDDLNIRYHQERDEIKAHFGIQKLLYLTAKR